MHVSSVVSPNGCVCGVCGVVRTRVLMLGSRYCISSTSHTLSFVVFSSIMTKLAVKIVSFPTCTSYPWWMHIVSGNVEVMFNFEVTFNVEVMFNVEVTFNV